VLPPVIRKVRPAASAPGALDEVTRST
jgi:hypothetical protein